ncbi:MAG TPA: FHA domain-containing protein, partial [Planctomycetota bacterium]|nr:FHA domain-containing protein [Planctomycetota bacterium]
MGAWGRIRVLDGPIAGTVFFLDRPVLHLGRAAESDLRVPDATVSRNQAELRCGHDGVILVGLSDKNPLWVNGEPLQGPRMLHPGDRFQAGLVHMEFEAVEPPLSTATAGGPHQPEASPATMLHGGAVHPTSTGRTDLRCPRCGAKELPGARYCGSCGAALPSAVIATMQTMIPASMQPQAPPPAPAPPPPPPPPPSPVASPGAAQTAAPPV